MTMLDDELRVVPEAKTPRASVIARMTEIVDAFMTGPQRLLLEDVAAITGLPRSTAFRIMTQLVELRWLEHDARGYRLGTRTLGLGARGTDHSELRSAASAALTELHLATGAVAHLGVLEDASVHYLDKVGGASATTVPSRVGARVSAESTVIGRALLACLPAERVDALLGASCDAGDWSALARLHGQLNTVRQRRGLAVMQGTRCSMGIGSVAAPILGPEGAVAAISVAGRGQLRLDTVAPMVARAARQTSRLLYPGWSGARPGPGVSCA